MIDSVLSRKHLILLSAVAMNFFLGANYAWSIFAQELKLHHGFSMTQCQLVYSILQITFTAVFILGGRLHDRFGPRIIGSIGGISFGLGYFLAGTCGISFPSLAFFIGIMGGVGVGFGYICPLAAAQKCFPDRKAPVTGIVVGSFGLGPICIALFAQYLLKQSVPLETIFRILGAVFFTVITGAALTLKLPSGYKEQGSLKVNIRAILSTREFWSLFFPMCAGLFAGLMVIGNLKPMGITWLIPEIQAAIGVSVLALFNGAGRIAWGFITGRIGEDLSIKLSLILQAATLFGGALLKLDPLIYFIFAALVGFNYGASLVVYASKVSISFGVERLGSVYPVLFTCNGLAGFISPLFAGWIFDRTGSYTSALFTAGVLCLAGFTAFIALSRKRIVL